jgi:hypothetical protein
MALGERDYDLIISQKRPEIYTLDHKIKALHREKDNITNDADDRVKLELKKDELEKCKKKRKKMYAPPSPFNFSLYYDFVVSDISIPIRPVFFFPFR